MQMLKKSWFLIPLFIVVLIIIMTLMWINLDSERGLDFIILFNFLFPFGSMYLDNDRTLPVVFNNIIRDIFPYEIVYLFVTFVTGVAFVIVGFVFF